MKEFQERVVEEKNQLDEKISRLMDFVNVGDVFPDLDTNEKLRLHEQLAVMRRYSNILSERIENFNG